MDVITSFKIAARDFQKSEMYERYHAAKKANDEDKALQDDIGAFNLVRLDLENEMEKEDRDSGRINEMNQRVNELYSAIMKNPNMTAYNEAKDEVEGFMNYVNDIMNAAIQGEDPMAVEQAAPDCTSDCATCGSDCC